MKIFTLLFLSLTAFVSAATTITPQPTDLWDNYPNTAYNASGYYPNNCFARLIVRTGSRTATIRVYSTSTATYAYPIGVRVNGVDYSSPSATSVAAGIQTIVAVLPIGLNKTVEIVSSALDAQTPGGQVNGNHIIDVTFDDLATIILPQKPFVTVYGDSITAGGVADVRCLQGWASMLRNDLDTAIEAYGFRRLSDDAASAQQQGQFANRLASYGSTIIWLAIGTNDYGVAGAGTAATFGTQYAALLDKIRYYAPNATIYCQSPIIRITETANGSGSTLDDFRSQIVAAAAARPSYCVFVDGKKILALSELSSDGLHPGTAGNLVYLNYVRTVLNLGPTIATATATLDFPSIAALGTAELTVTIPSAINDAVFVGPPATLPSGLIVNQFVSAVNTVTIRLYNSTGAAIDPAASTWRATVRK